MFLLFSESVRDFFEDEFSKLKKFLMLLENCEEFEVSFLLDKSELTLVKNLLGLIFPEYSLELLDCGFTEPLLDRCQGVPVDMYAWPLLILGVPCWPYTLWDVDLILTLGYALL